MKNSNKGFTLIELLVVIAIIGLLSTLAVVALNSARQRSRDAKRVADIRQIQTALELAFSETDDYPNTNSADEVLGDPDTDNNVVLCNVSGAASFEAGTNNCGTVFMGLVPANPSPGGAPYTYNSDGADYSLTFTLEGATGQLGSGPNCANPDGITSASSC